MTKINHVIGTKTTSDDDEQRRIIPRNPYPASPQIRDRLNPATGGWIRVFFEGHATPKKFRRGVASAGHLVTVTDERHASVIVHRHHLLFPIVIYRSSARTGVITPAEGNNTVAVAHPYLLLAAPVTSQHIVRLAAAAPPSSVMSSRSVTIVRHHHPLFIVIIPRAPQSDRQRSSIVQDQQNRHRGAAIAPRCCASR